MNNAILIDALEKIAKNGPEIQPECTKFYYANIARKALEEFKKQ